ARDLGVETVRDLAVRIFIGEANEVRRVGLELALDGTEIVSSRKGPATEIVVDDAAIRSNVRERVPFVANAAEANGEHRERRDDERPDLHPARSAFEDEIGCALR